MQQVQTILQAAQEHFDAQEFAMSLQLLVEGFCLDNEYQPFYTLAAQTLRALEADEEAQLFEAVIQDFESVLPFYKLGYHFIETAQWDLAIAFLKRAHALAPEHISVAYEYSLALGARFQVKQALDVLKSVDYPADFWASYRVYYCEILTNGDIATAKEFIRYIRQEIYKQESQDENDTFALQKLEELQGMMRRLVAVENPISHIRDWHFIQYGSMCLDYFEDTQENLAVAGGRWNYIWLSAGSLRTILDKLVQLLEKADFSFTKILYCQNRDAEILAKIIGKLIHLPCIPISSDNCKDPHSLLVANQAADFNAWQQLMTKEENHVTFSIWVSFLEDAVFCPEILGMIAQQVFLPWQGGLEIGTGLQAHPDTRKTDIIAEEIASLSPDYAENDKFPQHLDWFIEHISLAGAKSHKGNRFYFTPESPLGGSYFK